MVLFTPLPVFFVYSSLSNIPFLLLTMEPSIATSRAHLEQIILAQRNPSFPMFYSPYDLSNDFVPLYGCRRRSSEPSLCTWGAPPPSYDDLMQTIDYRHDGRPPRFRSSMALSDILEEEDVEVIICDIVPPSPTSSTNSSSTLSSVRSKLSPASVSNKLRNLARAFRVKLRKHRPAVVVNDGSKTGLDLFSS